MRNVVLMITARIDVSDNILILYTGIQQNTLGTSYFKIN